MDVLSLRAGDRLEEAGTSNSIAGAVTQLVNAADATPQRRDGQAGAAWLPAAPGLLDAASCWQCRRRCFKRCCCCQALRAAGGRDVRALRSGKQTWASGGRSW